MNSIAEDSPEPFKCHEHGFYSWVRQCPHCQDEHCWKFKKALTPSAETKAAYSGEFFEQIEMPNPDYCGCGSATCSQIPETYTVDVPVSWDTIKKIMAMIRERAGM